MQNCNGNELIGLFESIQENDEKVADHKGTIKELNLDSKAQIDEFAKEKEIKPKAVKAAYKYWKEQAIDGEAGEDDFFTLCALVDMAIKEDSEEE